MIALERHFASFVMGGQPKTKTFETRRKEGNGGNGNEIIEVMAFLNAFATLALFPISPFAPKYVWLK
jgi:hypothetical protein